MRNAATAQTFAALVSATARETEKLRDEYRTIAAKSHAEDREQFTKRVRAHLGARAELATPAEWVAAAKVTRIPCRRCAQTGLFITMVENGQPKGPGGECYRCAGKGWQNHEDACRNAVADRFYIARAI